MSAQIEPFELAIPDGDLEDLRRRLAATRWPDQETPEDWSQGIPLAYMREVAAYWADGYDWRRCEALLNGLPQFRTELDGLEIHFLHVRSPHPDALPLVITHGWPSSIIEFHKVIGRLTDPTAHGGDAADAFHVVAPSLPGFGFSGKPTRPGWTTQRTGAAWAELMARLGYDGYVAQGGDWGAMVTEAIGQQDPEHCRAIHLNMVRARPDPETMDDLSPLEREGLAGMKHYRDWDSGYSKQQSTRPQTVGYGLADSPVGQAAWILEKFWAWTDCDGHPENVLGRDEMLDNVMLYWLPDAAASSARIYWESFGKVPADEISLPVGCSIFPKEIFRVSRRWAAQRFTNIIHWNELDRGGHFAAFEQPGIFVDELRACFRQVR
ncbi:MAG: epoxide hydrolase [Alphaproteobacteria bacterium]|jgi:pimeloyl-ACP methyl ester carboxylesterase|nr:epoxide hydrolase [Alphaproteobacteria bacterium]MDP6565704.1 epoxide hydrolase [Alphaproteobacteria bacterium]MDP6814986.1 epoxide hydrolase [Alphaproteobacteria bacterium]